VSLLLSPFTLSGIDDPDHPLGPRVDLKVSNLNRLAVAPPMPVERLDQIKLKPEQLGGVGAIGIDEVFGHLVLALT
jgi:hypothetical protein